MLATQDVYPSSTAHLTNEERCERLREKAFIIDMQLLSFARESAEFAVTKAWEEEGSETAIDWLRFNCHMTSNAAADLIAVGKNLGRMPNTVQAVCEGEIGVAHVKAMARTANAVGTKFDEAPLLEKARENSPGKFYYICNHYRHAADRQGYEAEQARLVENRRLWITTCDDGTVLLSGSFDPEGGATLRTAIEPLARKSGAHDHRSREKRLGDAVVDLSMHALDSGLIPQQATQRPHLMVTTSLETLRGTARRRLSSSFAPCRSRPRPSSAWHATLRSLASCSARTRWSSMSGGPSEPSPGRLAKRSMSATEAAPGRAASGRRAGAQDTI